MHELANHQPLRAEFERRCKDKAQKVMVRCKVCRSAVGRFRERRRAGLDV